MPTNFSKPTKIPVTDNLDIHVRSVIVTEGDKTATGVEIREYIKNTEVYGHGLIVPTGAINEVATALTRWSLQVAE